MKVYRAVFKYNNCDSCEWERWYEKCSPWYDKKDLAEKHLPLLVQYMDYLCCKVASNHFEYIEPYIEELDVYDVIQDFKIVDDFDEKEFTGFEYVKYRGKYKITSCEFEDLSTSWDLFVTIDNEVKYKITFDKYTNGQFRIRKGYDTPEYFKYDKQDKETLDTIISSLASKVVEIYRNYIKTNDVYMDLLEKTEGEEHHATWVSMWENQLKSIIYVVTTFNMTITERTKDRYNNFYPKIFKKHNADGLLKLADVFVTVGSK